MSLNIVSRIALAVGALTIATLPAFAETSPAPVAATTSMSSTAHATAKPVVKSHVKKATLHHKKKSKSLVQHTGLATPKAATPKSASAKL